MMPDVEKDEVRDSTIGEGKLVGVLRLVNPGIGKDISGYAMGNDCLNLPQARAYFDRRQTQILTAPRENLAVESLVNSAQCGLSPP